MGYRENWGTAVSERRLAHPCLHINDARAHVSCGAQKLTQRNATRQPCLAGRSGSSRSSRSALCRRGCDAVLPAGRDGVESSSRRRPEAHYSRWPGPSRVPATTLSSRCTRATRSANKPTSRHAPGDGWVVHNGMLASTLHGEQAGSAIANQTEGVRDICGRMRARGK